MPTKNTVASETAISYVKKYPDMPSRQLGRMMYAKNKLVFPSENAALCAIRYRRGAAGNKNREYVKAGPLAEYIDTTPASKYNPLNPLALPESDEKEWVQFKFDGTKKVLVISDLHIPYHTIKAVTCALQDGLNEGVDGILINGDLIDFHQISRFIRDPKKRTFKEEKAMVVAFLRRLRELFPKARIVYKEGNHDERLWNYLAPRVPEIFDDEDIRSALSLKNLLKPDEIGIEWVGEKREILLGKLPVLHGHEMRSGFAPPVNPARGAYLKAKECVMVGHHHRTSEHTETTLGRKLVTTWSTGCLCDLRPMYDPYNSYNHGHAIVSIANDGAFHVQNKRQLNGVIL
jgi:predicted phosphodiesterase